MTSNFRYMRAFNINQQSRYVNISFVCCHDSLFFVHDKANAIIIICHFQDVSSTKMFVTTLRLALTVC